MSRFASLAVLSALVFVTGCKDEKDKADDPATTTPEAETEAFAQDGTDSSAADTDTQLVTSSLVSAAPGNVTLATELAAYVNRRCVEVRPPSGGNEVTYVFTDCLGRNGLVGLSGTVVAKADTKSASKLHLTLTFTDLKVNGAVVDGSAEAEIDAEGAERSMTWSATLDGTTAGGKKFSHTSRHTVAWNLGDACFELDGFSDGTVGQREIKTEISSFRRCGRGCPEAGGKIVVTNKLKGKQTSLEYDGTNRATFTGPNGKPTAVPLFCKP